MSTLINISNKNDFAIKYTVYLILRIRDGLGVYILISLHGHIYGRTSSMTYAPIKVFSCKNKVEP